MGRDFRPRAWSMFGLLAAVILIPATIAISLQIPSLTLASTLLILFLEVVAVALVSNLWIALATAIAAVMAANWFLVPPQHTFIVESTSDIVVLCVFTVTAALASLLVRWMLAMREEAVRSQIVADTYRSVVTDPASISDPRPALRQILVLLDLDELELRDAAGHVVASVRNERAGEAERSAEDSAFVDEELIDDYRLVGTGPVVVAADRGLIVSLGTAAVRSHQNSLLSPRPPARA
jgi:Domain of unknown function (DUF4118)